MSIKTQRVAGAWILCVALCASFLFLVSPLKAQVATAKFFITWHADTYTSPGYAGKALPTNSSRISASLLVIDGGKAVDLSGQTVYWYINGSFLTGGIGLQTISVQAPSTGNGFLSIRARLPDYAGGLAKTIQIPVGSPVVVIESPYPTDHFFGTSATVHAVPYFFNISEAGALIFSWLVNGQSPENAENPQSLTVNVGNNGVAGTGLSISVSARNPSNAAEIGNNNLTLFSGR